MSEVLDAPTPAAALPRAEAARCRCGSGLSEMRCCAQDLRTVTPVAAGDAPTPVLAQMVQAYADSELELAERLAVSVLEETPGHKEALATLYNVCKDSQRPDAADVLIRRVVALHPNDSMARLILAQFLLSRGALEEAVNHARRLVQLAPEEVVTHLTLAQAFAAAHALPAAEHHFRRALALAEKPGPMILAGLADIQRRLGRFEEARSHFSRADALGAGYLSLLNWAALEEADRKFEAAGALLDRAAKIAPRDGRIAIARANLHIRTREYDAAVDELDRLAERRGEAELGVAALLERGRALDAMGRYDEAFEAFATGKRKARESGSVYNAELAENLAARLKGFFTEGRSKLLPRAGVRAETPQPIFIVGFPRSGTTLVEQMLSGHPYVAGGDELPTITQMAQRLSVLLTSPLPYPQSLSELWLGDKIGEVDNLRDHYLNEARRHGAITPGKRWFTDKMPLNETHLGLIHLLFPQAPIIHLIRHPLDIMVSVHSNGLTHGFNCASGLDTAASHLALTADLVKHYRQVLPLNYVQVRYEDLVDDLPGQAARLLTFVGAPFAPQVLDFHENTRAARTASYAQVTEKLYDRSRYRHRNYLRHLAPIVPVLEPLIRELGYPSVEIPAVAAVG
jgi:tetratricopeptide (TPR) repeat protein